MDYKLWIDGEWEDAKEGDMMSAKAIGDYQTIKHLIIALSST